MTDVLETTDVKDVTKRLADAVESRGWLAIIGDAGCGKTTSLRSAIERTPDLITVQPACLQAERIDIGYVLSWVVWDLANQGYGEGEQPRRSLAAREVQACRLLGEAAHHRRVVVVLEEAQRLHWRTLQSLKRMREMAFCGMSPLFTLVLVGQPELENVLAIRREVRYRVRRMRVRGLAPGEFDAYAQLRGWPKLLSADAQDSLDGLTWTEERGRSYIEVEARLEDASRLAGVRGHKHIEREDVDDVFTSLRSRLVKCDLSLGALARKLGIPKSTVHAAMERGSGKVYEQARAAVEQVERKSA